ncbi:hypothetical protein Ga0061079_1207 [Apibacter mensalis]|uniref:Uncharacterized protein n=2 Tax=Apibacter mensalis TaxID=1586267 RepID=A0A0X3AS75_9FLAO|nr:hypothetical protein Ga0061079_1207 [Apibacter mensalis]
MNRMVLTKMGFSEKFKIIVISEFVMSKKRYKNPNEIILVVMKKEMSIEKYYLLLEKMRKDGFKGWRIQGYELGFYQEDKGYKEI